MNPNPTVLPGQYTPVVDSTMSSTGSGFFDVISAVFPFLFVGIIVYIVFSGIRHYQAAQRGGVDPFAVDTELKVRAINSDLLRGAGRHVEPKPPVAEAERSVEERLAELDDLAERGVISAEERAAARLGVLGGD